MDNLQKMLGSRLFRNIYFWVFVALFMLTLNPGADAYDQSVYLFYKFLTTVLLFLLTCTNNFLLVPRTLGKKKWGLFIVGMLLQLLVFSVVYIVLLKQMLNAYPKVNIYDVSIITSPVAADWSLSSFANEIPTFAFGLFLWVVAFVMAWYMNDHAKQKKRAQEALRKQTETELHLLRSQLSPHFLFNTLNNIYGLSLSKSDAAPESILKLSSLMRYMLYESAPMVSFEKEKEVMQAYIDMELLRLQDKGNLSFNITADKSYNIPSLLWLPILENAFKYATRVIVDDYFINYDFNIKDGVLSIISRNSFKEVEQKDKGGVGLSNLKKRLEILYPDSYILKEEKENGTYNISLQIKLS